MQPIDKDNYEVKMKMPVFNEQRLQYGKQRYIEGLVHGSIVAIIVMTIGFAFGVMLVKLLT